MKSVLFVYRILLPPLFLLWPSQLQLAEANTENQTMLENTESWERYDTHITNMQLLGKFILHKNDNNGKSSTAMRKVSSRSCPVERNLLKDYLKISNLVPTSTFNKSEISKEDSHNRQDSYYSSPHFGNAEVYQDTKLYQPKHEIMNNISLASKGSLITDGIIKFKNQLYNGSLHRRISSGSLHRYVNSSNQASGTMPFHRIPYHRARRTAQEAQQFGYRRPRQVPPEYMVHLFQLLSESNYKIMRNVVVTGFLSMKTEEKFEKFGKVMSRTHKLVFSVFVPEEMETVHYAELRVFIIPEQNHSSAENSQFSSDRNQSCRITVFEVNSGTNSERRLIASKNLVASSTTWISFDITSAVKIWFSSGLRTLETRLDISGSDEENITRDNERNNDIGLALIPNIAFESEKEPLLVVFSKKFEYPPRERHDRQKREIYRNWRLKRFFNKTTKLKNNVEHQTETKDLLLNSLYFNGLVEFVSTLGAGSSQDLSSKKLYFSRNNLRQAETDLPRTFVDMEKDYLLKTVYNITFLNIHERFQPHSKDYSTKQLPRISNKNLTTDGNWQSKRNYTFPKVQHPDIMSQIMSVPNKTTKLSENLMKSKIRRDTKARYRRHLDSLFREQDRNTAARFRRSKKKRNSCQRGELYVDFETIKWDKVIIFPRGYQAFTCTGKCYAPISEYLTPTKHAIIQTLVHTSYPDQASRACCVPTKLEPISILYWDENGDIKYEFTYEGMVVAECGCR